MFDSCIFFLKEKLFPAIQLYWKTYQDKLLSRLKDLGQKVVIAGDGRHDRMRHSAKFGAYTIFCCTLPLIIHFTLVQVIMAIFLLNLSDRILFSGIIFISSQHDL